MKFAALLLLLLMALISQAQNVGTRTNTAGQMLERYVTNSPGNVPGNSRVVEYYRDSANHGLLSLNVFVSRLDSTHDDGVAPNIVFVTNRGSLRRGRFPSLSADSTRFVTYTALLARGFLTSYTETDPKWIGDSGKYFTKTASDLRYLRSFTETDPLYTAGIVNYYTKTQLQTAGQASVAWGNLTGKPAYAPAAVTRALNTSFQPSLTAPTQVSYSLQIVCILSLLAGQTGTMYLEVSQNGSIWVEAGRFVSSNSGLIGLTNTHSTQLTALVPAGYFVRIRTVGTATFSYLSGVETAM